MFQAELEEGVKKNIDFLTRQLDPVIKFAEEQDAFFNSVTKAIGEYTRSGKLPALSSIFKTDDRNSETDSLKENEELTVKKEPVSPQKPKRKALKENTQQHNEDAEPQVQVAPQKPSLRVKREKQSILNEAASKNSIDDMPPPPRPIKTEKNTRTTRARTKRNDKTKNEMLEEKCRDSDVLLNNVTIPMLEISSDDETEMQKSEKASSTSSVHSETNKTTVVKPNTIRSTRSRVKQNKKVESSNEKPKRSRSSSAEVSTSKTRTAKGKQTKRKKAEDTDIKTDSSTYEDALDEEKQSANAMQHPTEPSTPVEAPKEPVSNSHVMNETYVQPSSTNNNILADIMTDDDSPVTMPAKPVVEVAAKAKTKQLFSPFEKSPVKKRVQAYENLVAEAASEIPVRTTRTKTRALAKLKDTEEDAKLVVAEEPKPKEKPKYGTPLGTSRYLPTTSHSTSKAMKHSSNESLLGPKSLTSFKSSQAEFRERELRRQKEAQKREALLQAQIEEKRRRREEKQLKAQQQREALEKEKLKHLEDAEKAREEKLKQTLAERDVKLIKQKEEMERKRQLAKKKALEEKLKEEKKKAELRNRDKMDLVYMATEAPLLPTPDCYDSDHEAPEEVVLPAWCEGEQLKRTQKCMHAIGEKLKNTFFARESGVIDLKEIFQKIDPRKLKRTSSAVWRTPPRFAMLSKLDATVERNDSSTDEE